MGMNIIQGSTRSLRDSIDELKSDADSLGDSIDKLRSDTDSIEKVLMDVVGDGSLIMYGSHNGEDDGSGSSIILDPVTLDYTTEPEDFNSSVFTGPNGTLYYQDSSNEFKPVDADSLTEFGVSNNIDLFTTGVGYLDGMLYVGSNDLGNFLIDPETMETLDSKQGNPGIIDRISYITTGEEYFYVSDFNEVVKKVSIDLEALDPFIVEEEYEVGGITNGLLWIGDNRIFHTDTFGMRLLDENLNVVSEIDTTGFRFGEESYDGKHIYVGGDLNGDEVVFKVYPHESRIEIVDTLYASDINDEFDDVDLEGDVSGIMPVVFSGGLYVLIKDEVDNSNYIISLRKRDMDLIGYVSLEDELVGEDDDRLVTYASVI